jgi:hypothetical protein
MDEMRLKLSTRFMRNIAAKLLSRAIYKKLGYKVDLQLNDLDVKMVDGETYISTNVEAKINSREFMKIMKSIGMED